MEPADLESEDLRRPGKHLVFALTANDIISLAINVIQNGWSYGELPLSSGPFPLQRRDAPIARLAHQGSAPSARKSVRMR